MSLDEYRWITIDTQIELDICIHTYVCISYINLYTTYRCNPPWRARMKGPELSKRRCFTLPFSLALRRGMRLPFPIPIPSITIPPVPFNLSQWDEIYRPVGGTLQMDAKFLLGSLLASGICMPETGWGMFGMQSWATCSCVMRSGQCDWHSHHMFHHNSGPWSKSREDCRIAA